MKAHAGHYLLLFFPLHAATAFAFVFAFAFALLSLAGALAYYSDDDSVRKGFHRWRL